MAEFWNPTGNDRRLCVKAAQHHPATAHRLTGKHQRTAAPVLSQRHRPERLRTRRLRARRPGTERTARKCSAELPQPSACVINLSARKPVGVATTPRIRPVREVLRPHTEQNAGCSYPYSPQSRYESSARGRRRPLSRRGHRWRIVGLVGSPLTATRRPLLRTPVTPSTGVDVCHREIMLASPVICLPPYVRPLSGRLSAVPAPSGTDVVRAWAGRPPGPRPLTGILPGLGDRFPAVVSSGGDR